MEVGCPGTQGLELPTPNPGSKNIPKACPTRNPATSPARPISHSPQGARPEAPDPSKRKPASTIPATLIDWKPHLESQLVCGYNVDKGH